MEAQSLPPDRISNLHSNLKQAILSRLPIRDAFRTSILSHNWRYSCLKIPKLEFRDNFVITINDQSKALRAIYTVLLLHHGPVIEFSLHVTYLKSCCEIDQIILHLAKNETTVEKFTLYFYIPCNDHKLPSSFFSLHKLTHLKLHNCAIRPLSNDFKFGRLISLSFHNVSISIRTLLCFLRSCPMLKSFTLLQDEKHFTRTEYCDFAELFKCIPLVEYLRMNYCPVKCFALGVNPFKLPNAPIHLKVLDLSELSFAKEDELYSALLLVTSSPNIEKVKMEMYYSPNDIVSNAAMNLLDLQEYSNVTLDRLRELEITNFGNKKPGMDFVKFILAKSSMLKKVRVVINSQIAVNDEVKMQRDMLTYLRASTSAQVIFKRP